MRSSSCADPKGRKCQVFAVYTQKRDVTQRLKSILSRDGIRVELLTTAVPPEAREAWYERQLKAGMEVCICHPKLVQTGLDLLFANTLIFYESGYSTYVLRQASRRSWRIGQRKPVRVIFLDYANTAQESCLRLMGKKMLVSLAMEGKFSNDGLQALDEDDDMLTAMARELVTQKGVGEKADQIWRELQQQHRPALTAPAVAVVEEPMPAPLVEYPERPPRALESGETLGALAQLGLARPRPVRRPRYDNDAQLSLGF